MIWDLEFKREKTLQIREEIRVSYDASKAKLAACDELIKQEKNKAEKARIEDEKVRLNRDVERYEAQMASLEIDVQGANPSSENPDGVSGINDQLDALHQLLLMVNAFIKKI